MCSVLKSDLAQNLVGAFRNVKARRAEVDAPTYPTFPQQLKYLQFMWNQQNVEK